MHAYTIVYPFHFNWVKKACL